MIFRMIFFIVTVLFSHVLFANPMSSKVVTYTEDTLNITTTKASPQFVIQLKSNPTTGYTWFLREYDDKFILPQKHLFKPSSKKLAGAPGIEEWVFSIKPLGFIVPQQTVIRFVYARPWESDSQAREVVFKVSTLGA